MLVVTGRRSPGAAGPLRVQYRLGSSSSNISIIGTRRSLPKQSRREGPTLNLSLNLNLNLNQWALKAVVGSGPAASAGSLAEWQARDVVLT